MCHMFALHSSLGDWGVIVVIVSYVRSCKDSLALDMGIKLILSSSDHLETCGLSQ